MKNFSTFLKLIAVMLLMGAWSGTVQAQPVLQVTADANQVTQ